jgi:outer membrane protein insertion porin family
MRAAWLLLAAGVLAGAAGPALAWQAGASVPRPGEGAPAEQPAPPKGPAERPEEARPSAAPIPELEIFEGRVVRAIILRQPVLQPKAKVEPSTPDPESVQPAKKPEPAPAAAGATYKPLPGALAQLALNQIRTAEGGPYSQRVVSEDMTRLNRLGRFKGIENAVELLSDGSVNLIFTLTPQQVVADVQPAGNTVISDEDIRDRVEVLIGSPVDRFALDRGCRRIEEMYREKGYYLAKVSVDEKQLDETGTVVFVISEGQQLKVSKIAFDGNKSFAPGLLKNELQTTEAWLLNRGKLDDQILEDDVATLTKFYKDRGYLEVRVASRVTPSQDGKEAIVTFVIDEGAIYTLRSLKIDPGTGEGASGLGRFTEAQLLALTSIKPGDIYSDLELKRSIEAVEAAYGALGYTDVKVDKRELRVPESNQVDLLLFIREGRAYRTGLVEVQGNDLTQKSVILRHLQVKPERPLDASAIKDSKQRLEDINLFAPAKVRITPQPARSDEPDVRDVLVEVEETNTGSFEFGAAVSSDAGLFGRFGITQRNFDLYDTPDSWSEFWSGRAFRGAGQTFSILLSPGTRYQNYAVSLFEPSVFDSDYSASASVYLSTSDYQEYNEARFGAKAALGRRFGKRWNLSMPLRVEGVKLNDIEPDAPTDVFKVKDQKFITGLGLNATRQSLDDIYRPTEGSTVNLGVEQVGAAGGDFTFTAVRAEHKIFFPIGEDYLGRRTVVSLTSRANYLTGGADSVPIYERIFLGGQSFRGFKFRSVSPKGIRNDNNQPGAGPVGGTWMFFFSPQLQYPIYERLLDGVAFIDSGTVNDGFKMSDYRISVGFGFRVYIRQLTPAPLAFDFGIPIRKGPGDEKRLFNFSVDVPF